MNHPRRRRAPRPAIEDVWTDVDLLDEKLRMYARRSGPPDSERTFVLVHGLGVSGRYMVPLLERLGGSAIAWAPDLPGFGHSPGPRAVLDVRRLADVLAQWMERRGITRPVLLGNSMGCQVVTALAAERADAIAGIVLVGPIEDCSTTSRWAQIARWLGTATREPMSMIGIAIRDYLRAGFRRTWRTFTVAHATATTRVYPDVPCPGLVIRGERDVVVNQAWAERVAALLPRGRLQVIRRAAHAAHYDRPDDVARAVETFALGLDRRAR